MKLWKRKLLKLFSLAICTVPPALATLHYFPIWYKESKFEIVIPGVAVLCFCLCSIPLLRWVIKKIKTPSVWMVWTVMAVLLVAMEKILPQLTIICEIGAVTNIAGALLWKIAERGGRST